MPLTAIARSLSRLSGGEHGAILVCVDLVSLSRLSGGELWKLSMSGFDVSLSRLSGGELIVR